VVKHVDVSRTGLNQRTLTPPIDPDELAADSPGDRGRPADAASGGPPRTFDLTNAFSIDGWYGDAYTDLIPDRTDATIVLGAAADSLGAAHIAARLGLETTGITLPLTRVADKLRTPEREASPILVGRSNVLVDRLVKIGRARLDDLLPGEGAVQVVPRPLATATVVAGRDAAGTEAAAHCAARRMCGTTRADRSRCPSLCRPIASRRHGGGQAARSTRKRRGHRGWRQDARVGGRRCSGAGRRGARRTSPARCSERASPRR
jgi:hypothetical protein